MATTRENIKAIWLLLESGFLNLELAELNSVNQHFATGAAKLLTGYWNCTPAWNNNIPIIQQQVKDLQNLIAEYLNPELANQVNPRRTVFTVYKEIQSAKKQQLNEMLRNILTTWSQMIVGYKDSMVDADPQYVDMSKGIEIYLNFLREHNKRSHQKLVDTQVNQMSNEVKAQFSDGRPMVPETELNKMAGMYTESQKQVRALNMCLPLLNTSLGTLARISKLTMDGAVQKELLAFQESLEDAREANHDVGMFLPAPGRRQKGGSMLEAKKEAVSISTSNGQSQQSTQLRNS